MAMYNDGDYCCRSPQTEFAVPNGDGKLANDQRAAIALPEGTISAEGIAAVSRMLLKECQRHSIIEYYYLAYDLTPLGDKFLDTGGNYAKRLSARAYKTRGVKLPAGILEQVGMIAREHSSAPASSSIEVTRQLNNGPGYFYHTDSCWWGSYSYSRCTLKTNGGFGIRSFRGTGEVAGRAWVMPLKLHPRGSSLIPTFNTETPAAYVVFNGYGQLEGYTAPRLLSLMTGWQYARTEFGCDQMSVNSGSFLVAPDTAQFIPGPGLRGGVYLNPLRHASLFDDELRAELIRQEARQRAEQAEQDRSLALLRQKVPVPCPVCRVKHKAGSAIGVRHATQAVPVFA